MQQIAPEMIELPAEILEIIIEIFISQYKDLHSSRSNAIKFLPQWYLTPLLRVSKLWCQLSERHLYQSIAVGSKFPRHFPSLDGESFEERKELLRRILETQLRQPGHITAEILVNTLAKNSRLASMVKELQLGIEDDNHDEVPEWTLTIISIIRLCPNVEQVEIRGFHYTKLDKLMAALKTKSSLVSLHISPRNLSNLGMRGGTASQLFEAMQSWPKLKSITADGFLDVTRRGEPLSAEATSLTKCCPELQTLVFTGADLDATDLKALRMMCPGVTNLHIPIQGGQGKNGEETLDALSDCLRAWSSTLECVRLKVREYRVAYAPFCDALSTLRNLRELHIDFMEVEINSISKLPRLSHLLCSSMGSTTQIDNLTDSLEEPDTFPSLSVVAVRLNPDVEYGQRLENNCMWRSVWLQKYDDQLSSFSL